ncbi:hypothetical protein CHUAL_005669 [Chamberlinius hualienensis]
MSVSICSCCKEKSFKILFCCVKKLNCRECYQEVCKNCWNNEICHTCYVRDRPDANSVERLKELETDELERLMKTLHLDPIKKSENDWINMIAQYCGLPMKIQQTTSTKESDPDANGNAIQTKTLNITESVKPKSPMPNGVMKSPIKTQTSVVKSPIKTHAVTRVNGVLQNKSSLHGHIIHEMTAKNETTDYDNDSDSEYDVRVKEDTVDYDYHDESPAISNRYKWSMPTLIDERSDEIQVLPAQSNFATPSDNFSKNEVVVTSNKVEPTKVQRNPSIVKIEELNEIDVKILRNIEQRRPLTLSEKLSLEKFESSQNTVKSPPYYRSAVSLESTRPVDSKEVPVANNFKDIASLYGTSRKQAQTTKLPLIEENIQVIEITNNEKVKNKLSINPPAAEPVKYIGNSVNPLNKLVEPAINKVEPAINKVEPAINQVEPTIKTMLPTIKKVEPTSKKVELTIKREELTIKREKPTIKRVEPTIKTVEPVSKLLTPVKKSSEPLVVINSAKENAPIADIHRKNVLASWHKVANVNTVIKRDSTASRTDLPAASKSIEIVSKETGTADKKQPIRTSVPKTEKLNKQSIDLLLTSIKSETNIQKMDILQIRKIFRQLNVKTSQDAIKREELVKELTSLWLQASQTKKIADDNSPKEMIIVVSNQPLRNTQTPNKSSATQVKVFNFNTISSEDQIRKLNIFQLKSLLTEEGAQKDVIGSNGKEELVEKAIKRWRTSKV